MFSYPFSRDYGELALCGGSGKESFQTKCLGGGKLVHTGLRNTGVQPFCFADMVVANALLLSLGSFNWRGVLYINEKESSNSLGGWGNVTGALVQYNLQWFCKTTQLLSYFLYITWKTSMHIAEIPKCTSRRSHAGLAGLKGQEAFHYFFIQTLKPHMGPLSSKHVRSERASTPRRAVSTGQAASQQHSSNHPRPHLQSRRHRYSSSCAHLPIPP